MASTNLPPLRRDLDDYLQLEDNKIFGDTAIDYKNYSNYKPTDKLNGVKKQKNKNFFKNNTDDLTSESDFHDPTLERKLVPMGYFERTESSFGNPNETNNAHRYTDNKVSNSVEFPQLNRTLKTETLYSIKSHQNASPHSRMVQSMEKVGIKAVKAFLPTESLTQDGTGFKDAGEPIIK
jgi:hypothetical protein